LGARHNYNESRFYTFQIKWYLLQVGQVFFLK
jgi:hypothetical protein